MQTFREKQQLGIVDVDLTFDQSLFAKPPKQSTPHLFRIQTRRISSYNVLYGYQRCCYEEKWHCRVMGEFMSLRL